MSGTWFTASISSHLPYPNAELQLKESQAALAQQRAEADARIKAAAATNVSTRKHRATFRVTYTCVFGCEVCYKV